eukprot:CAMPEP_0170621474 /NCGR_PEP_ID=MMETSP0224-20130122/28618_1 /TAXON_ID=285029 /ORGANISM="Togula jolla, Strain CCCM 725" /LENGTH=345 /DNA_ID=CAMNT_0010947731 /DNA_START=50 /DNA_END=1087 /DNA_ORIENTATION=+
MFEFCGLAGRDDLPSKHVKLGANIDALVECLETTVAEERRRSEVKDQELSELKVLVAKLCSATQATDSSREQEKSSMLARMARQQSLDFDAKLASPSRGIQRASSLSSTTCSEHFSEEIVAELEAKLQAVQSELLEVKEAQNSMGNKLIQAERHVAELQNELAEELALRRKAQEEASANARQLREFQEKMGDPWSSMMSPVPAYRDVRRSSSKEAGGSFELFYSELQRGSRESLAPGASLYTVFDAPEVDEGSDSFSSGTQSMTMQSSTTSMRSISERPMRLGAQPASAHSTGFAKITNFLYERPRQGAVSQQCEVTAIHTPLCSPAPEHRDCSVGSHGAVPSLD